MELFIRNVDFALTDELRGHAQRRAEKLDRFLDRVTDAQLELRRRPQRSGGDVTRVQLTIHAGRSLLRAEEEDHDARKAIDRAFDKLLHQVRRFHDRRTERKSTPPHRTTAFDGLRPLEPDEIESLGDGVPDEDDELISEPRRGIVRTKRFQLKPMRPEEAVDQMELLGHDFYLFLNDDEGQMNVVYRRRDGSFGLLAPELS
jgi:putative sigma-54 modulation protein